MQQATENKDTIQEIIDYLGLEEVKRPLYSICICNYNMADTLEKSLTSLLEQLDDRFEVVIVDDGSDDNSVQIIEDMSKTYPCIRVIPLKRDSKRKLGLTRNISIQEAKGEYVLLHLDCDDIFGPYLTDFVEVFHKVESCLDRQILLSGQHINMANREFLLSHGPYLNMYRGEDRNLWVRMAEIDAYIPLNHIDFIERLPKSSSVRFKKTIKDTFDHMRNDFRGGISLPGYIRYEFLKLRSLSWKLFIFRLLMLIPARIASYFDTPIPKVEKINSPEAFAEYRDKVRGTYQEIMRKNGGDPDLSFLSKDAQSIFLMSGHET